MKIELNFFAHISFLADGTSINNSVSNDLEKDDISSPTNVSSSLILLHKVVITIVFVLYAI